MFQEFKSNFETNLSHSQMPRSVVKFTNNYNKMKIQTDLLNYKSNCRKKLTLSISTNKIIIRP